MRHIFSRLSKREQRILYISVAVISAVFFDRMVIHPFMNKTKKLNSEILIQEKRLQKSLHTLSQEEVIISEHKKYTQDLKQICSDEEEKSRLLSEIEKLAKGSSVVLKDIKPGLTEETGPYKKYTVVIELESEISFLVDFIYQLEKSPQLLRVTSFYLIPIKGKPAILKTQMTITKIQIVSKDD